MRWLMCSTACPVCFCVSKVLSKKFGIFLFFYFFLCFKLIFFWFFQIILIRRCQKWFFKNKKTLFWCISEWKTLWKATTTTLPNTLKSFGKAYYPEINAIFFLHFCYKLCNKANERSLLVFHMFGVANW
jgi:hypothetical protein